MQLIEKQINSREWSERISKSVAGAFRSVGFRPDMLDTLAVEQALRIRILGPKWHEEGKIRSSEGYLRAIARFCVLTYLVERDAGDSLESCITMEPEKLENFDPLYGGSFLRRMADDDEILQTAPYEVQFTYEAPEVSKYRKDPFAIPTFRVVDRKDAAIRTRWRNGQQKYMGFQDTSYHSHRALQHQKDRYTACLRRAMPGYMNWLGIDALRPVDRQVLRCINDSHLCDADVKRQLKIAPSTYYDLMARLAKRGFEDFEGTDGLRVLKYNPVLDSTVRFMDRDSYERIFSLSTAEVIEENDHLFERILASTRLTADDVMQMARKQRQELLKAKMGLDAIERHDARLRVFIKRSVERPVIGKGVTLEQVETLLKRVPKEQARNLVFRSLRFQKPITELFGLTYVMRDYAGSLL